MPLLSNLRVIPKKRLPCGVEAKGGMLSVSTATILMANLPQAFAASGAGRRLDIHFLICAPYRHNAVIITPCEQRRLRSEGYPDPRC